MTSVTICIATCKRPKMLSNLLCSLSVQTVLKNQNVRLKIAVVDNDSFGSARSVVCKWRNHINDVPILYEVEKRRGISFVRNRLFSLAKGSEYSAFIDDDEIAKNNWIEELLYVQNTYNADVIAGPVLPKYQEQPPDWVLKGKFFERPQYETGDIVLSAGTGNVLVRNSLLEKINGPFEEKLHLQGGEDTLLFTQLRILYGTHIIWANQAIVIERIPSTRTKVPWLIKRRFCNGLTMGMIESYIAGSMSGWRIVRLVKGIGNIIRGSLLLMPAAFSGKSEQVQAICFLAVGAGSIASTINVKHNEYKVIHGN
jgi:succinoglycan biosynthesis protein ExoM